MERLYRVGDLIVPDPNDEKVQRGLLDFYQSPMTVVRVWADDTLLDFVDARGRKNSGWYQHRFLSAEIPYDPTQMGDKEDDI